MFYSDIILAKKGPLANIWLAAHLTKKLSKTQIFDTNIEDSVESIAKPEHPLALRVSGHLLLGVVRIFSRQVRYLAADCNFARSALSRQYNNPRVDLPPNAGSGSLNLAIGFGSFEEEDVDLMYSVPDVKRWASLAVYQRMDGSDDIDEPSINNTSIDLDDPTTHHSNMMTQGDAPQSFTSFGGNDMTAFDMDVEPEVGRNAPRDSLGFDASPVRRGSVATVTAFDNMEPDQAPVDDTFNFDNLDEQPDSFEQSDIIAGLDKNLSADASNSGNIDTNTREEETISEFKQASAGKPNKNTKRRRFAVIFDDITTIPRKALKMKLRDVAQPSAIRDRDLRIWRHDDHVLASVNPISQSRLNTLFLQPTIGVNSTSFTNMFASAVQGTLRIGSTKPASNLSSPSKRSRSAISAIDEIDEVEVMRRKTEISEFGDTSALGDVQDDWMNGMEGESTFEAAPLDNTMDDGGTTDRPHNAEFEEAVRSHQMQATVGSEVHAAESSNKPSEADSDELHPRTLVVMRQINKEFGIGDHSKLSKSKASKTLRFQDMISGFSKAPAAAAFFEILALKTRGYIDVQQGMSFSDISVSTTGLFVDTSN